MMDRMDLVLCVDSGPLYLAATTTTKTFSIFGPSSAHIYKPSGSNHNAFQNGCPHNILFVKRCPILRTCKTGACMKETCPSSLINFFSENNIIK